MKIIFQSFSVILVSCFLIALTPAGTPNVTVSGRVLDVQGKGVSEARVTLANLAAGIERFTATDGNGSYSFADVSPGSYRLTAAAQGLISVTRTVEVGEEAVRADLELALRSVEKAARGIARKARPVTATASATSDSNYAVTRVFYATDRKQTGDTRPARFYGSARLLMKRSTEELL